MLKHHEIKGTKLIQVIGGTAFETRQCGSTENILILFTIILPTKKQKLDLPQISHEQRAISDEISVGVLMR